MLPDPPASPFQPGTGSSPPVLAGREDEQAALKALLDGLRSGELKQTIHLVQASRGMGKTVLLRDLEKRAPSEVAVIYAPAPTMPTLGDIARRIEPSHPWGHRIAGWFSSLNVVGVTIKRPDAASEGEFQMLERALARRRKTSFLLIVDEAHTLSPPLAHILLNVFQSLAGRQPCGLLLAGTPALMPLLLSDAVDASFVERAPIIVPGLLSAAQSRQALDVPDWRAWKKDEATLNAVVAESMGYPYFLQLWGKALWEKGYPRTAIDTDVLQDARTQVDEVRREFYARRYDEFEADAIEVGIDRDAMLSAVLAIAEHVASPDAFISTGEINWHLEDAGIDSEHAVDAKKIIIDRGFLTRAADDWRPSIPSLAAYICAHPR